ncbi:MAG TPA: HD domain-containing phosphohydrolase [Candidatus Limnocylindria bacterium]|nr:HD domain-containing phosphohydrolase [Candidatus Limnocylindria bacterium]
MSQGLERELVLVAEDDAANRALLSRLLERAGYRSVTVADGRDAIKAAVDEAPDLVLLDVGLPGLNGLDVCRRLRADPRTVALPIILVTGQVASRDVVAGLDAGADDFVRKPYDEAELMARVRSVLRLARVTAEMVGAHGVIAALANAVEAKDASTELHCQRLAGLAHRLGLQVGMEPAALKGLVFGALLHDIGKIGVSDAILTKPGPLSRQEWAEMRLHPLIGERICEPLTTASLFAPIVRHHHERWDGAGYPDGLGGERIPLGARIVGLVDAFDAIIHDRPYRPARSIDEAIEELKRESGAQFDPDLVRLFLPQIERDPEHELRPPGVRAFEALRPAV